MLTPYTLACQYWCCFCCMDITRVSQWASPQPHPIQSVRMRFLTGRGGLTAERGIRGCHSGGGPGWILLQVFQLLPCTQIRALQGLHARISQGFHCFRHKVAFTSVKVIGRTVTTVISSLFAKLALLNSQTV